MIRPAIVAVVGVVVAGLLSPPGTAQELIETAKEDKEKTGKVHEVPVKILGNGTCKISAKWATLIVQQNDEVAWVVDSECDRDLTVSTGDFMRLPAAVRGGELKDDVLDPSKLTKIVKKLSGDEFRAKIKIKADKDYGIAYSYKIWVEDTKAREIKACQGIMEVMP